MMPASQTLVQIQQKIDEVRQFLTIALSIANAHTVEFYTHDVWSRFMAVAPKEVLSAVTARNDHQREHESKENGEYHTTFGFCPESHRLANIHELLKAARMLSLPGLGICLSRNELLLSIQQICSSSGSSTEDTVGEMFETDEFMNSKKSHEVQGMSEVIAHLARGCQVKQVIDVGSGKGYLSSFLSMQYGLQVYGIDSSSINTHGAQERNRKLKKFSKAYQKHSKVQKRTSLQEEETQSINIALNEQTEVEEKNVPLFSGENCGVKGHLEHKEIIQESAGDLFLSALSLDIVETTSLRVSPSQLTDEERERRKRENLERKAQNRTGSDSPMFSPLTSYVTAETELRALIGDLQAAVLVGLHTCGDLAPSSLRMFVAKTELAAVCSVGCCYHLLSEEFDPNTQDDAKSVCGFPLSQYLREQSCFCGRNARMSACLALERVSHGQGIQMESLFYRAVLHVILRDHYGSFKSAKRVGNVYSKSNSFVDYVRRALQRLELDEMKLSDSDIQGYHDKYRPRMNEMHAFNMLKVTLAPCIEGFLLLDRLCYLKEQENVSYSALVQLFDPLLSPRCYAVIGLKKNR